MAQSYGISCPFGPPAHIDIVVLGVGIVKRYILPIGIISGFIVISIIPYQVHKVFTLGNLFEQMRHFGPRSSRTFFSPEVLGSIEISIFWSISKCLFVEIKKLIGRHGMIMSLHSAHR